MVTRSTCPDHQSVEAHFVRKRNLMATYSSRVVESRRYEWFIPTPAPWAEVEKAFMAACHRFAEQNGREVSYDNDIQVTCGDDEVVLFFEISGTVAKSSARINN